MNLSRLFSLALLGLTALSTVAPSVDAHNQAKYTNIPFVLPASCSGGTARWINQNRALALSLTSPTLTTYVGFQIFNSVPGSDSGSASTSSGFVPAGTYSFAISNLPAGGVSPHIYAILGAGSADVLLETTVTTPGVVTFTVPANSYAVEGYIYNAAYSNVLLTNFTQNNQAILSDTTQVAYSSANNYFNFCY